jgi:excisionase family DNA binding protein
LETLDRRGEQREREWLRPGEVAPQLGVTTKRVYQLIREGELPAITIGGAIRIPRRAWSEWLDRLNSSALSKVQSGKGRAHGDKNPLLEMEVAELIGMVDEKIASVLAEAGIPDDLEDGLWDDVWDGTPGADTDEDLDSFGDGLEEGWGL